MKNYYIFIALAMVAAMSVSCKSNKKAESNEANEEVVEAAKTILADDVLATIDEIAESFKNEENIVDVPSIISSSLTEQEKLIKPDYLLDPAQASEMISKSQKVNALAIYITERTIRKAFEMPIEETDEAIAHLSAEVDLPHPFDDYDNLTRSERFSKFYNACVERGDVAFFWQFSFALQQELVFLIAQNPDPFFRSISDEQLFSFHERFASCLHAVSELAKYDEEIALAVKIFQENDAIPDDKDADIIYSSVENAKKHIIEAKDVFAVRRTNLLK